MCLGGYLWGCCEPHLRVRPILPPNPQPHLPIHIPPPIPQKFEPVPLTGVIVNVKIVDFCAEVTLQQRYENVEQVPIEATYVFPLEERASVSDFYATVDGKKVNGIIKEKEQARDAYDDAIASGKSAYLLEEVEDKKNQFKTSIGNLPPKSEVVITVVYVTDLNFNSDNKLEFVLPTNTKAFPDGVVNQRFFVPMVKKEPSIPYGLKVSVELDMTSKIKGVSSPSHPIEYETGDSPNEARVTLANNDVGVPLTKNFELNIGLAEPNKPVFRVQGDVGMLALYPDLTSEDEPITEMIFVVDRSGSMSGAKIQRVKDTLQIFLRSLPLGTLFNIVGFGSNYVSLFPKSVEYDDDTLAKATQHVNDMKANLGGTNLLSPLKVVLAGEPREGIPRQIFVLTDGEVDNTQACIDFVREHSNTSRVFAFGIHGASPELVNGIAKAGEGKAELILGNENIENKVMAQLKRALQPALTNLRIEWGKLDAQQTPFLLPPVFNGSRVIAYGYLPSTATKDTITFKADTANGPYSFSMEADPKKVFPGNFIPKLAARSMIRDLEEKRSSYHKKGSLSEKDTKDKIIALSIKNGMLSKYTAFVAVNESNKAVEGTMETRDVNEQLKLNSAPVFNNYIHMIPAAPLNTGAPIRQSFTLGGAGGRGGYNAPMAPQRAFAAPPPAQAFGGFGGAPPPPPPGNSHRFFDGTADLLGGIGAGAERNKAASPRGAMNSFSAPPPPAGPSGGAFLQQSMRKSESKEKKKSMSRSSSYDEEEADFSPIQDQFAAAPKPQSASYQSYSTPTSSSSMATPISSFAKLSTVPSAPITTPASSSSTGEVKAIVMKQKAAGNFSDDVLSVAGIPNVTVAGLKAHTPKEIASVTSPILEQILVILFICGILQKKFAADKDQWELVERKAYTWVKKESKKLGVPETTDWKTLSTQLASKF